RVRLLGPAVPLGVRWASVSVAKLAQVAAQVVFVLLGLALVLPRLTSVSRGVAWVARAGAALLAFVALAWLLRRGVWATLHGVAGRLGLAGRVPAGWEGTGRALDATLTRLGHGRVVASLACFVAAWAVGAAEIYLILKW